MNSTTIILGICTFIAFILVWFLWYIYRLEEPTIGSCDSLKAKDPSIKWDSKCGYIQELKPDDTIRTPSEAMTLTKFTHSPSLGSPWGVKVWYRYRYVNGKTGSYGKFSPWTKTPIFAGSSNETCKSNLPELSIGNLDYPLHSEYVINVHRYVAELNSQIDPTPETQDYIVGMASPDSSTGSAKFIDTSKSPCLEMTCSSVKGC